MVDGISPATGEHAFLVQFRYAGSRPCSVAGYPTVRFLTPSGAMIPFRYSDSGGQYLTHAAPSTINLRPADTFFVAIAKYRCDVRTEQSARWATLLLPGAASSIRVDLRRRFATSIDYCAEAPSKIVYLSPLEPVESRLFT
jgi:hypothetical protein